MPASGVKAKEGTSVVSRPMSAAATQRMRQAMTPSRPGRVTLMRERINVSFFREAIAELRKVHWPTREQARNLTLLVIGVSILVGVILGAVDFVFEKIFEVILRV